jgi:ribosomal-protein-alanine N-acetyltransferase
VASLGGPGLPPLVPAAGRPVFPPTHRWPVSLSFDEVVLDPFRRRDLEPWQRLRADNRDWLSPWEATRPPGVEPPSYSHWTRLRRETRDGRTTPWLVRDARAPGRPLVGQCVIDNIVWGSARFATLSYWIAREWAGRGLTPVAAALAVDYAILVMGLHRVEICVRPENRASLRVVEKLGFRDEGFRPRYIHIAGQWRDHRAFALDASEIGGGLTGRVITGRR